MTAFVQLQQLTRQYTQGENVIRPLHEVDLEVERGEFFALLGPSGSGKSTLLNLLAGIDRASSGAVRVDGADLGAMGAGALARWRAKTVGYVFQQHNLVPVLTAYENVELPLGLFSMRRSERHTRVSIALEAVGLADRHGSLPRQLSGGQQQRVAIARAIVADPSLLLADEPTGSLDEDSAKAVLTILGRLNRERGTTVVMVTHDPRAAAVASRAMHLDKGRLEEATSPAEGRR